MSRSSSRGSCPTFGPSGTFLAFGLFATAALVFVLLFVPETKGRTLEELEQRSDVAGQGDMTPLNHTGAAKKKRNTATAKQSTPTLEMVAKEAGVSMATVSRIINGTAKVSAERKSAVEKAIAKLNFRPNQAARGLAMGKSTTIGVITQAIDSPFYGEGLRGIEHYLQQHGYAALFMSGNWNEEDEARCMRELLARRVDGIIIFSGRLDDRELARYAKRVPIVLSGRRLKAPGVFSFPIDDRAGRGARHAAPDRARPPAHRLHRGHSGSPGRRRAAQRLSTRARRGRHCIRPASSSCRATGTKKAACDATLRLLASNIKFTALFCVNDQTAYGACLALYRSGLSVSARCLRRRLRRPALVLVSRAAAHYRAPIHSRARRELRRKPCCSCSRASGRASRCRQVELVVRESTAAPNPNRK